MGQVFDNGFDDVIREKNYDGPTASGQVEIGGKVYDMHEPDYRGVPSPPKSKLQSSGKIESIEIGGKVYDL